MTDPNVFCLTMDNKRLREENAKLRGERDMYYYLVSCMVHPNHPDQLSIENAKLWELVTEVIHLMQANSPDCGLCKHYDECWTGEAMNYSPSGCVVCNEARELGIEMD